MYFNHRKFDSFKKKYDKNGYVVIRNIFNKTDIDKAGQDLEKFFKKSALDLKGRNINKTKNNIINSVHFMNNWKWSKKLKKNKILNQLAKVLLNDTIKDFGSELFAKPANVGLASPMHQDNYYWCLNNANGLTIWIALDDSSKNNGGVFYFSKSHKLGLLEHTISYAPGSSQTLKHPEGMQSFKKIIPNIRRGDCLIHHSLVVHGSNKNFSSYARRGLTIRYIGKKSYIDKLKKKNYEKDLKLNLK